LHFVYQETYMHQGTIQFFHYTKGYGFVKDHTDGLEYFIHLSGLWEEVQQGDEVIFDLEEGAEGMHAVEVKLI
jgi:CspA family cold shock protein